MRTISTVFTESTKGMPMLVNTRTVRIEWGDCDPAGIVFYPRYFEIFDACTHYLFERATGMHKRDMTNKYGALGFPMVDTRATFSIASRFGDEVEIATTIREFRQSSFDVYHRLTKDGRLAVEGFETRVWVGHNADRLGAMRAAPVPAELVALFANHAAPGG
jgi:4-hydroxybenzoyl-CoA thioesterase